MENRKKIGMVLLACGCFCFIPLLQALTCKITADQILKELKDRNQSQQNSPSSTEKKEKAAWENLKWLQDNLGIPLEQKPIEYKLYLWKEYGTIAINGVFGGESIGNSGVTTAPFQKPMLNELIAKLGQPQKVSSQILTQNTWKCENDNVVALIDDEGIVINMAVSGYGVMGLNGFRLQTELYQAFNNKQETSQKDYRTQQIDNYNTYYNTAFKTEEEITKDILEKTKIYYQNLRECKKGAYDFPGIGYGGIIYRIASIIGSENNSCNVKIYQEPDKNTNDYFRQECQFSMDKIKLFDEKAAEDSIPTPGKESNSATQLSEAQKLDSNSCKEFHNDREIQKNLIP